MASRRFLEEHMLNKHPLSEKSTPFELANQTLHEVLLGRHLILVDRFASAGRNTYTGPMPIPTFCPSLAISYYETWGKAQPQVVISSEAQCSVRDRNAKHQFLSSLNGDIQSSLLGVHQPLSVTAWNATTELCNLFR